ncbi:OmpA family protein [Celeribacter sp. PS-C1]|uniref:OmpA family protein n=1 Tax=Celeribacter sp. PS-C1 TaxID=2820813 RepID=UPI001C6743D9|nr:OmpA family protein [Celeribacter sp. PS-C1]MBW6416492.1 OmpA family protein [Celeribacter sp. PS-C1]
MRLTPRLAFCLTSAFYGLVSACAAAALDLPGAASETARQSELTSAEPFPTGPYQGADTPRIMAEGDVERVAYRVTGTSLTSRQLITPLRSQLESEGFQTLFSCADTVCGGFDFRYQLDVLPEPAMHVDLSDYEYLVAEHADGRVVALLTSHAPGAGFVQISTVTPSDAPPLELTTPSQTNLTQSLRPSPATGDLVTRLEARGRVVLDDLAFDTGSATLGTGPFTSLQNLAAYLTSHPDVRIILVGHTDNTGALESNTNLSRQRAQAVRQRLINTYGVPSGQISADGIGYLAPRVSNATPEGREQNRRVEAVIASTQ